MRSNFLYCRYQNKQTIVSVSSAPIIHHHKGDLPPDIGWGTSIAVDTETMGLNPVRDSLCVVQLSAGDGEVHVVQLDRTTFDAPILVKLLGDTSVLKIFHYARFDIAFLKKYLGVETQPVYCTKIASKLVRTYTDKHGLKDLCKELLGVDLSKQQQSSDWGAETLTDAQLAYAASDVLYLHQLKDRLDQMLSRENRTHLAQECFDFLSTRAELDLRGWTEMDIFSH